MDSILTTNNSLQKFLQKIPGRNQDPRDVDAVITPFGDFKELEGIDVIVRSLYRLFLMVEGTYIFDPEIGLGLHRYIFELGDTITQDDLDREIRNAISRYETRANITHTTTLFSNKKGFRIDLFITFKGQKTKLTINFDESLLRTIGRESSNVTQSLDS